MDAIAGIDDYLTSVEEGRLAAALREGAVDHVVENYRGVQHGCGRPGFCGIAPYLAVENDGFHGTHCEHAR